MSTGRDAVKLLAIAMIGCCVSAYGEVWPEDPPSAIASAEAVILRLSPKSPCVSSFTIEAQSRMSVEMRLIPKTTLMGLMTLGGDCTISPKSAELTVQDLSAQVASMSYYEPGAANRDIPRDRITQTLFASGLPAPEYPVRLTLDKRGVIVAAEGVPEKFTKFYEVTLLEYPDGPVKPGDVWSSSRTIPVSPDPDSETVMCDTIATFSLEAVDRVSDSASIAFKSRIESCPAVSSDAAVINGTAEGKIEIRLSDGVPRSSVCVSQTRLDFDSGNIVQLEQRIRSDFLPRQ